MMEPTGNTADNVDDHVPELNWYTIEVAEIEVEPELYVTFPGAFTVHNTAPDTPVDVKLSLNVRRNSPPLSVVVNVETWGFPNVTCVAAEVVVNPPCVDTN